MTGGGIIRFSYICGCVHLEIVASWRSIGVKIGVTETVNPTDEVLNSLRLSITEGWIIVGVYDEYARLRLSFGEQIPPVKYVEHLVKREGGCAGWIIVSIQIPAVYIK